MKAMKKLSCVLLAVLLLMSLSVTAFASGSAPTVSDPDQTFTLTIEEEGEGHAYVAYQIFSGTLTVEDGAETLTNITFGSDVDAALLLSTLEVKDEDGQPVTVDTKNAAELAAKAFVGKSQDEVQTMIDKLVKAGAITGTGTALEQGDKVYSATVKTGYYMVKDTVNADVEGFAMTDYIVQVLGDMSMKPKASAPSVEKKVQDTNDSTGVTSGWQDSADYDIGDKIPYQITVTLPSTYADYSTYKVVITDTLSKGLTFNNDIAFTPALADGSYEIATSTAEDGSTVVTVTIADLKTAAEGLAYPGTLTLTYSANLDEDAVAGTAGNPNTVILEYSNNPTGEGTGHTPDDTVTVFTFSLNVNKVDEEKQPLSGAEFEMAKFVGTDPTVADAWKNLTVQKSGENGNVFTAEGLDEGIYRVTESATPAGYNSIDPFYVKIDAVDDGTGVTSLTATQVEYKDNAWVTVSDKPIATFNGSVDTGVVSADIVNQSGLQLPETGGIGTTIFYTVGGILVAAALVLLITKKRMSKEG